MNLAAIGVALAPALEASIHERAAALGTLYPRLVGCSVVIDGPDSARRRKGPYDVHLDLSVPGAEPITIDRRRRDRLEEALNEVFDVATRRLEELARFQCGEPQAASPSPSSPASAEEPGGEL